MTETVKIELTGLAARVREAVECSTEPDAITIAHELCQSLAPEEVEEALARGVRLLVEREARSQRSQALRAAREERAQERALEAPRGKPSKTAQRRLDAMTQEHQQRVAERFFAIWKETPTGRKFLGECTVDDLRYSAERHRERSEQALRHAACDDSLADALAASGADTVRELGYEAAAEAMQVAED